MEEKSREKLDRPLARQIGRVGPTPTGAFAVTTFSQHQMDDLVRQPGTVSWLYAKEARELTLSRAETGKPLATFNLANRDHRRALADVLARGTLHLCAIDSLDPRTGALVGAKLAVDIGLGDRLAIEMAIET